MVDDWGYEQDGTYYGELGESMPMPPSPAPYTPITDRLKWPPLVVPPEPPTPSRLIAVNPTEIKPMTIPPSESRFASGRGGFIERVGVPRSRMEIRYEPMGQPFVSRGGTPGVSESGGAFQELPQQNVLPAASSLFPQGAPITGTTPAGAPITPLDTTISALEKQMADYVKYSPENIAAQARAEGRPASDIPVLIERYGKMRGDVKYKDLMDSYKGLIELKRGGKPEKPTEGLRTTTTAEGIMQWNPKTQRYDIKIGETPETAGMRRVVAKEKAATQKETLKESQTMETNRFISSKVDEALGQIGIMETGFTGAALAKIPGTDAYNLNKTIDTIKANVGFEQLNAMRQSSPTGGALGQVALKELDFLQAALGSLEVGQGRAQLERNLKGIKTHYDNWAKNQQTYLKERKGIDRPSTAQSGVMQELPSAAQYSGRIIRNHTTGKRLQSNGQSWVEVQ